MFDPAGTAVEFETGVARLVRSGPVFDELSLGLVHEAAEKIAVNKTKINIALIRSPLSGIVIVGKGRLCRLANRERYLKVKVDF